MSAKKYYPARISSGGRVPLLGGDSSSSLLNAHPAPAVFKPSEFEKKTELLAPVLGHAFSKKAADSVNDVTRQPVFDLNDPKLVQEYLPGFTVQRQVQYGEMESWEKNFLQKAIRTAQRSYPKAAYIVIYADDSSSNDDADDTAIDETPTTTVEASDDNDNNNLNNNNRNNNNDKLPRKWWVVDQSGDYPDLEAQFNPHLRNILQTGQLYGCEVRGAWDTGQFGLVANRDLPPGTPIAVECGLIWGEAKHDELVASDAMLGLASNYIPAHMLQDFVSQKDWRTFRRKSRQSRNKKNRHHHQRRGDDRIPGFVLDCSSHGNETKHIDDPGWLHAGHGSQVTEANVESHLVLDLVRGMPTVGFFVKDGFHVRKGDELTMDWGCWRNISSSLLPGQALLSTRKYQECEKLKRTCENLNIPIPTMQELSEELDKLEPLFFNPKDAKMRIPQKERELLGEKYTLLYDYLFPSDDDDDEEGTSDDENTRKKQKHCWYEPLPKGTIDYLDRSACVAVRPTDRQKCFLSERSRRILNQITVNSTDVAVQPLLDAQDMASRVEVVRITDIRNPACTFCLPGETPYGVIAKRSFQKDDPVLCYGGLLRDDEDQDESLETDPYLFNVDLGVILNKEDYDGPALFVWGKDSIAGKINDAISIGGATEREPNLRGWMHFDRASHTPQLVFYATKDIHKGEELLFSYGVAYWKVMWRGLMMSHAVETAKLSLLSQKIQERIEQYLGQTDWRKGTFHLKPKSK